MNCGGTNRFRILQIRPPICSNRNWRYPYLPWSPRSLTRATKNLVSKFCRLGRNLKATREWQGRNFQRAENADKKIVQKYARMFIQQYEFSFIEVSLRNNGAENETHYCSTCIIWPIFCFKVIFPNTSSTLIGAARPIIARSTSRNRRPIW